MNDEEFAEQVYEAYYVAVNGTAFSGDEMLTWSELPERIKGAWRAAADYAYFIAYEDGFEDGRQAGYEEGFDDGAYEASR